MDGNEPTSHDGALTPPANDVFAEGSLEWTGATPVVTAPTAGDLVEQTTEHAALDPDRSGAGDGGPTEPGDSDDRPSWFERISSPQFLSRVFSFIVVAACCGYVFWTLHPDLIFRNTTPTGGDLGAHVWGPAYLRDELLPNFRLTGWSPDWYAGFPAYTFYMVLPSLLIVMIEAGFVTPNSFLGVVGAMLLLLGSAWAAYELRRVGSRLARAAGWTACVLVPLLTISFPYNIAFKIVVVAGLVAFPAGVWFLLKALSLRQPGPELGAAVSVMFLMDKTLFHIYGGNIASTMAGEFAFSLSLTLSLFALGCIALGLKTGRYRVRAALLIAAAMLCHVIPGLFFLLVGSIFLVVLRLRKSSFTWALPVGLSGGLMAMWWYIPFYAKSDYLNDMGWEKLGVDVTTGTSCAVTTVTNWSQMRRNLLPFAPHSINGSVFQDPNMWNGKIVFVLAAIGVVLSLAMWVRAGVWLTLVTLTAALAFVYMPQDRFWNARVLPFYYLGVYLLAAVGVALLLKSIVMVVRGGWVDPSLTTSVAVTGVVMALLFVGFGMSLRMLPGGVTGAAGADGQSTYSWGWWNMTYQGVGGAWAKWNFEGLEAKPGFNEVPVTTAPTTTVPGATAAPTTTPPPIEYQTVLDDSSSNEYFGMIDEMRRVGKEFGCGRAFWEYDEKIGKYGTPMAPMLLPYFTDHCIGSMEGLYFEASSTTPFHFLVQSELSQKPSRPERFDCHLGFDTSPYQAFNLDLGIKHLQMLGVKYFMAMNDETKTAAADDPRLTPIGESAPWKVYEIADINLVEPVENLPEVWTDAHDDIYSWAKPAVEWFNEESRWNVLNATRGPSDWPRAKSTDDSVKKAAPHPDLEVTNVKTSLDMISFDVSEVGSPVLIRSSYFPNWEVEGASDVYRVTPNFMVVVPTSKSVTLTYGRSGTELVSALLALFGFLILIALIIWTPTAEVNRGREFFGDRDPVPPSGGDDGDLSSIGAEDGPPSTATDREDAEFDREETVTPDGFHLPPPPQAP